VDERLKRRLVGAFVLVSLAVIFLPMLLERPEGPEVRIDKSNLPPPPAPAGGFQSNVMPLPDDEPLIPPARAVAPPPAPATVAESEEEPVAGAPERKPEPRTGISAWVVQVASLSNKANADRLEADLRAKGHTAFLEQISVGGRTLFRVRVGPEVDRARAQRTAEKILEQFKLKGQVIRYP
jgi:DedD protein